MTHKMSVLSQRGDTTVTWDTENEASVADTKQQFDEMMAKGFLGYEDGKPTNVFNQEAEEIIVTPLVVGG